MEDTAWEQYGTGNYEKCADCMVHSGYESTAVMDAVKRPLHILKVALKGPDTEGPMAPEISLEHQRPAEYNYNEVVDARMAELARSKKPTRAPVIKRVPAE